MIDYDNTISISACTQSLEKASFSNYNDSVTFSIFVCPNKALIMEFCKYGSGLEVISPEDIRAKVAEEHVKASEKYKIPKI